MLRQTKGPAEKAAVAVEPPPGKSVLSLTYVQVMLAIVIGVAVGHFAPATGEALKPLGDLFIKLVKMMIGPVIFLTVVSGIAGMGELRAFGRVAAKAMSYFLSISTLALILGLIVANIVRPGAGLNIDPASLGGEPVTSFVNKAHDATMTGFVLEIIPDTMASAFTSGNILQVLLISILFGVAAAMSGHFAEPALSMIESISAIVMRIVSMLMRLAPLGAFGSIAFTIGKYGLDSLRNLAFLVATFYLTSFLFVACVLGVIAWLNGFSLVALLRYLKTELLMVLGTSSSEAALPNLIQKLEAAGCQRSVVGLVVPTGYSFNLDGTNIYMTMAALFIAQAMNVELTLAEQVTLLLVAMVSSKGAAGVTGAGFITLAATLAVVPTVPIAGLALILGVDRFMSECRSLTNFIGNAVATIVVARWENALDKQQLTEALSR